VLEALNPPVIVGREKELEKLQLILKAAIQGTGKTVFVSDEEGAGKTTLIKEFLKEAREEGAITLTGRCLSKATVPYFPFFEAFNSFCFQKKIFQPKYFRKTKHLKRIYSTRSY
jgi:predicted ATPase